MSANKKNFENINFDNDWECCCRPPTDKIDDIINVSSSSITKDNPQWSSVSLPHIIDKVTSSDENLNSSYNWWYRKKFNWRFCNKQPERKVYLMFDLPIDEDISSTSDTIVTIWINQVEIFEGSLLLQRKLIDLTENLIQSNQTIVNNKERNSLIVSCANTNLCFHARLIVHGRVDCVSGKMKIDDKILENNNEDDNNTLNYTVRVNDTDGLISVGFENWKATSKLSSSSLPLPSPTKYPGEFLIDDKQIKEDTEDLENIRVPRLAIVILIVGTRGDVQPFIA
jgi:hypothetical protein